MLHIFFSTDASYCLIKWYTIIAHCVYRYLLVYYHCSLCLQVPASVVLDIVSHCTNLEILTLAALKDIDDNIAAGLARNCKNARQISFRNCQITDDGVCEMAINCSKLTMVALAGVGHLTDKCVMALADNCHQIRELYVSGCAKITRQAITYLKVSS